MTYAQLNQKASPARGRERRNSDVVASPNRNANSRKAIVDVIVQLAVGFCGIALLFVSVRSYDRATRATADPILAETPNDIFHPFAGTRNEAHIHAAYREPAPSYATAVASTAANKSLDGIPTPMLEKALRFYGLRCAPCHGDHGGGDGLAAELIKPKPRSFADPEWQNSVSDEELASAILKGGTSVGKSYMMPASPDLRGKPDLVATLVRLVRSFGEP